MFDIAGKLPTPFDLPRLKNFFTDTDNASFRRRRNIIILSVAGLADAAFILMRQSGIIRKLPDLPGNIFDANKVTVSEKAYDMGLPDAALSSVAYGLTFVFATWGGDKTLYRKKILDKALFGIVAANALAGAQYFLNMVFKQKKICMYCVTGAALNIWMIKPAWEAMKDE